MRARQSGQSVLLLLDVATILVDHEIDYAVIGALAASVHGAIRSSVDADALISGGAAGLGRLSNAFKKAGMVTALRKGNDDDPIPALLAVSDRHGNRVDLLTGLRGLDPQAFGRSVEVPFKKQALRVIGREDFIAMKCFAGSAQDLEDARQVLALTQGAPDLGLLCRLARRFGRQASDNLDTLLATRA